MNSGKINRIRLYYREHRMFSELQGFDIGLRLFADNEQKKQNFWQKHKGKILAGAALAGLGGLAYANKDKIGDAINSWRIKKSIPAGMGTVPVISEVKMPKKGGSLEKNKEAKQTPAVEQTAQPETQNKTTDATKDPQMANPTSLENQKSVRTKQTTSSLPGEPNRIKSSQPGNNSYQWEGETEAVNKFAHGDTSNSHETLVTLEKSLNNISSLGMDPDRDLKRCIQFKTQLEQNIGHLNKKDCQEIVQELKGAESLLHKICRSQNKDWDWYSAPKSTDERMYNIISYCCGFAESVLCVKRD